MQNPPKLMEEQEFNATFRPPMCNVTDSADEIVDLWGYTDPIIDAEYHSCSAWEWQVAHIYETGDHQYQHIGIPVPKNDTYLTVVVDVPSKRIVGHYLLDLGALYGLQGSRRQV